MTIKDIRSTTDLSQSEFGKKFGIATVNISHWEQGISKPPEYVVQMISTILKLEERIKSLESERISNGYLHM